MSTPVNRGHILPADIPLAFQAFVIGPRSAFRPRMRYSWLGCLLLGGLLFAVNMLVNTDHGDTYSYREISSWLREAGFVNARTLDAPGPSPLILATKP